MAAAVVAVGRAVGISQVLRKPQSTRYSGDTQVAAVGRLAVNAPARGQQLKVVEESRRASKVVEDAARFSSNMQAARNARTKFKHQYETTFT